MYPLIENYLALYLSITKRYSTDKALRAMGIIRNYHKALKEAGGGIEDRNEKSHRGRKGGH
ncbi:hypothetical protein [Clostridium formicaceticum]|uniref:Uncharacterized protein n=1 Tax=Clostridium formicaceticum TaxID=1497 RepID=A0AAC9RNZ1_9CLOT|nr:hypothetical protein [Clostridium formicaceticum]AOY74708.1 hypothetical protein BJL90_01305 [Clostridium formicaceticum]ARE89087.1 hypothetical protein CLFO_34930 [Clostridium formicaceticum]